RSHRLADRSQLGLLGVRRLLKSLEHRRERTVIEDRLLPAGRYSVQILASLGRSFSGVFEPILAKDMSGRTLHRLGRAEKKTRGRLVSEKRPRSVVGHELGKSFQSHGLGSSGYASFLAHEEFLEAAFVLKSVDILGGAKNRAQANSARRC